MENKHVNIKNDIGSQVNDMINNAQLAVPKPTIKPLRNNGKLKK